MKDYLLFSILFIIVTAGYSQCNDRYQSEIFDSTVVTSLIFGENWNSSLEYQQLRVDVYEPYGDVEENRPMILLAHGGAFLDVVDQTSIEVVKMCQTLSKMGYVCASFDYREEANPIVLSFPERMIKAVFRSVQDGKAAVRYFKKSGEEDNPFRIDPDQFIIGGVSAGALVAVNMIYVTEATTFPLLWDIWLSQVGGLEGHTGSPGYNTDVLGIINISGAIGKRHWMQYNDIPLLSIHGTEDDIVPYGAGKPLGVPTLPTIFGSGIIHEEAVERGISSRLITYDGLGHVPFFNAFTFDSTATEEDIFNVEIWDSTIRQITSFSYGLLDCNPANQNTVTSILEHNSKHPNLFPNPSNGTLVIESEFLSREYMLEISDLSGTTYYKIAVDQFNSSMQFDLPNGLYHVRLISNDQNEKPHTLKWSIIK